MYYARADMAGLVRRLVAGGIDLAILLGMWVTLYSVWVAVGSERGIPGGWAYLASLAVGLLYLGPLKGSRLRTPGYQVAGVQLVDLRGRRPAWLATTVRGGLYLLGTNFALLDCFWFLVTGRRQKLSDQITGTYVIRFGALPTGRGRLVTAYYAGFGYFLVVPEVMPKVVDKAPVMEVP